MSDPAVEIGARDLVDHVGAGEHQQIVIALLVEAGVVAAAIGGLVQLVALDHRAEGAVGDQDALGGFGAEAIGFGHALPRIRVA